MEDNPHLVARIISLTEHPATPESRLPVSFLGTARQRAGSMKAPKWTRIRKAI
jgi:hypothetical protein